MICGFDICNPETKTETESKKETKQSSNFKQSHLKRKREDNEIQTKSKRLTNMYWMELSPDSDSASLDIHKTTLTVTPKRDDLTKGNSFTMWVNSSQLTLLTPPTFGVPRFYGIEQFGKDFKDETTIGVPMRDGIKFIGGLRDTVQYPQKQASEAWTAGGCNGVISLVCGSGKTVVAIKSAVDMGRRTLILVHKTDLIEQWAMQIAKFAPEAKIGKLQQNVIEIEGYDFTIGILHSLYKRNYPLLDTFGMVIVDEGHHIGARTFSQTMFKLRPKYTMGLTATPVRKDGLTDILYWLLGPLVYRSERCDVRPQYIYQVVYDQGNQKVIQYKGGRVAMASMVTRLTKDVARNNLILDQLRVLRSKPDIRKIIVLTDRRDHIDYLYDEIQEQFNIIPGKYLGGLSSSKMEEAKNQSIILATYPMAREALDIPNMNGMILATPIGDAEQVIGRLRESDCNRYVVDIVDPFSLFEGMSWKRFHLYKKFGYIINKIHWSPK